jgi:hypothetical protein
MCTIPPVAHGIGALQRASSRIERQRARPQDRSQRRSPALLGLDCVGGSVQVEAPAVKRARPPQAHRSEVPLDTLGKLADGSYPAPFSQLGAH